MPQQLPEPCLRLLKRQGGVIAGWQAESAGLGPRHIEMYVRSGRWQRMGPGVACAFTGSPGREAVLWAAVLGAGPQAVLSHQTAGGLYGVVEDAGRPIHVTVPHERRPGSGPGLVIHRSSRFLQVANPWFRPPRTQVEETIFDLTETADSFDDVVALLARACQRRVTTPFLLRSALERRPRVRWRKQITLALQDVADGVNSVLEFRYLHGVERAHGLPASDRQARAVHDGNTVFRDVRYSSYRVLVELDGMASHPDEQRWRDKHRDNAAAAEGWVSLRYGWADVHERACQTALQVGAVLARQGWTGAVRRCGPACHALFHDRVPFPTP